MRHSKLIAFVVMLSVVIGTVYMLPETIAKAWTDCTTTNTYSSHDFSSGCSGQTVTCSHTGKKGSCTVTGKGTGSHSYGSWQYSTNKDGTHYKYRYCNNSGCSHLNKNSGNETCDTSGTDGACSKCGYKVASCNGNHTWGSGQKGCKRVCTQCGATGDHEEGDNGKCKGCNKCMYDLANGVHNWNYTRTSSGHKPVSCQKCGLTWTGGEQSHSFSGNVCTVCGYDKSGCHIDSCGCKNHSCPATDAGSCSAQCWWSITPVDNGTPKFDEDFKLIEVTGGRAIFDGCSGHKNVEFKSMSFTLLTGTKCNYSYLLAANFTCDLCSGGHQITGIKINGGSHNMTWATYGDYKYTYLNETTHERFKYCKRGDYNPTERSGDNYGTGTHNYGFVSGSWGAWTEYQRVDNGDGTEQVYEKRKGKERCSGCGHEKDRWDYRNYKDGEPTPVITDPPTLTPEPTDPPPTDTPTPTPPTDPPTNPPTDPPTNPVTPPVNRYHTVKVSNKDANQHIYTCDGQSCQLGGSCNATYPENHHWVNNGASTVTQRTDSYKATYHNINQPQKCDATLPTATIFSNYTYGYPYNASTIDQNIKYSFLMSTFGVLNGAYQQFYTSASSCNATHTDTSMQQHSFIRNNTAYKDDDNGNTSLDTTHSRTCSECGYPDKVAHTYSKTGSYEYYENGTGHSKKCTTCGHIYTTTHTFPATWTNDTSKGDHYRVCTGCGKVEREAHTNYYGSFTDNGATTHIRYCSRCGNPNTDTHKYSTYTGNNGTSGYTYKYKNANQHSRNCTVATCNHEDGLANHSYVENPNQTWIDSAPTSGVSTGTHYRDCTGCGNRVTDNHHYDEVTTDKDGFHKYKCRECGHIYYKAFSYTVVFDVNKGNNVTGTGISNNKLTYTMGTTTGVTFPDCSRTDYVFKGWQKYSGFKTGNVTNTDPLTNGNTSYIAKGTALTFDGKDADGTTFTYVAIWEHQRENPTENTKLSIQGSYYQVSKTLTGLRGYYVKAGANGTPVTVTLNGIFTFPKANWIDYTNGINLQKHPTLSSVYSTYSNKTTSITTTTNGSNKVLPYKATTDTASPKTPFTVTVRSNEYITVNQYCSITDKWTDAHTTLSDKLLTNGSEWVTIVVDGTNPVLPTNEVEKLSTINWKDVVTYPITLVATESNNYDSGLSNDSYVKITNLTNSMTYTLKKTPTYDTDNTKIVKYTFETFDALNKDSLKTSLFDGEFQVEYMIKDNVGNSISGIIKNEISLTITDRHSVTDNKDFADTENLVLKKGATGSYRVLTTGNVERLEITYSTGNSWKISSSKPLYTYHGDVETITDKNQLEKQTSNLVKVTLTKYTNGNTNDRFCFTTPIKIPKGVTQITVVAYRGSAKKTGTVNVEILEEAISDDIYSFIQNQK